MGQRRTGEVVVALSGDVMLGRLVNETIRERGFAHPWGDILPVIKDSDAFLINLECALTSHAQHWTNGEEKAFYFRADPAVVRTLQIARVDFVSLANNHASDFETEGLLETVRVLDGAGIAHAGAGPDLAGASRPATIKVNSYRIAVIAYTDYPVAWAAEPSRPGVNYTKVSTHPKHMGKISDAITAARGLADLVIFTIHWGPNMVSRPSGVQGLRARRHRCRRRCLLGPQRSRRARNRDLAGETDSLRYRRLRRRLRHRSLSAKRSLGFVSATCAPSRDRRDRADSCKDRPYAG